MTEVVFENTKKMSDGKSEWRSPCRRFVAYRLRYLGRWVVYDLAQVHRDPEDRIVARGRTRAEVSRKLATVLPTLPPRARLAFLRTDGSLFKAQEVNPDVHEVNALVKAMGGAGGQWLLPQEVALLAPGTTGYIVWYELRGRWEACFGMTPAEAIEQAMAWGNPADPPGYGDAVSVPDGTP